MVSSISISYGYFYLLLIICLHTVKWFQVLLYITNKSIKQSFVSTQLNDQAIVFLPFQFSISHLFAHVLNSQTVLFDLLIGLSGTSTPDQNGSGSNDNEGVVHIPPNLQGWSFTIRRFNVILMTLVRCSVYSIAGLSTVVNIQFFLQKVVNDLQVATYPK